MKLLKRSYFGWGSSNSAPANPQSGLVIHYDGPGRNLSKKSHSACVAYWKWVRQFHMKSRAWADIGYSFGICPHKDKSGHGYVFEGRGLRRQQAAQPGGNSSHYSVTLMLGDNEKPTDIQIRTVQELHKYLRNEVGNSALVKGHRDFIATSCPGDLLYKMVRNGTFVPKPMGKNWPYKLTTVMAKGWGYKTPSEGVKKVQDRLNKLGYKPQLTEDGVFGENTEKAAIWFQRKYNFPPTGKISKSVWDHLFK